MSRNDTTAITEAARSALRPGDTTASASSTSEDGWRAAVIASQQSTQVLKALKRAREFHAHEPLSAIFVVNPSPGIRPMASIVRHTERTPQAIIVGRHTACDVPGVESASLRHVAVVLWPHRALAVEVLDLATRVGFSVGDGPAVHRTTTAHGACIRMNDAYVVALHLPAFEEPPADVRALLDYLAPEESWLSEVDHTNPATHLASSEGPRPADARRRSWHLTGKVVRALFRRTSRVEFEGDTAALEDGLVIGRYARCGTDMFKGNDRVSRVHAIVLLREGQLFVIDAASQNGTQVWSKDRKRHADLGVGKRMMPLAPDEELWIGESLVNVNIREK